MEMAAAATSEEGMETLIRDFEQIYQGYKDAVLEIQTLKSSYCAEITRREALELACSDLKNDNERLKKLYANSLTKLTHQMRCHIKCQSLKEELKDADDRLIGLEDNHRKAIEHLLQESELKIHDLERQLSCSLLQQAADKTLINQLQQDLAAHRTQIDILKTNLEQSAAGFDKKYHQEIHDLKDWILVEQEEKKELQKKLQNAECELLNLKTKQAEEQKESISIRHIETLKQKIMKLRKENESLKRQLHVSEL
ncbi:Cobalamin adenosyltransferase-like protein [Dioscorea alata]|uniref:Cobalamin adenosyltransferase-like protein n=3 Tax=Dioscorea alata TaxID=55571 RepID=A0ACB7WJ00_DIOAL|nr:Cobalamin adenosyltransferase-like protein [Dioscorea alata]